MTRTLPVFVLLIAFLTGRGQYTYDFNQRCARAYEEVISLRFDKGREMICEEMQIHPENNIPYLIENYIYFLTLFIGEDERDLDRMKNERGHIFERLDKGTHESPWYRYALAQYYLQWAFARTKFREYLPALKEINSAYRLLEKNNELYPGFLPNMVSLGLIHTLIGTVPDNFEWIKNIAGVEGTVNQGVGELIHVMDATEDQPEYLYLRTECLYYLSFIQTNLTAEKEQTLDYAGWYREKGLIERNPLIQYAVSRIFMVNGMNDEALGVLMSRSMGDEYYPFWYLDYLTGLGKLYRGDDDAVIYLLRFVINFRGINYIKAGYQKIAWFYLLRGDENKYTEYMNRVLDYGSSIVDDDKQAEREARKGPVPNTLLLRARLQFDGGYYEQAAATLLAGEAKKHIRDQRDTLEVLYRLGRIYHEWGKTEQAIPYYIQTIGRGAQSPHYYAANSALKLGNIYEERGMMEEALKYYKMVPQMKNEEYRNSISQKAKAGQNRLERKR
ncbi:MAG: tetratricopeptide repeat protein [Bacteroidales bacterium]|nr:tetratricopeptide repeat protein [Bacteroidales bacterium]